MKIIWSPLAVEKISEIAEYISRDDPIAATNWVNSIFNRARQIKSFPEIGRSVPEIRRSEIRELVYGNYRIIYRLETEQISILTVRHFKQILPIEDLDAF